MTQFYSLTVIFLHCHWKESVWTLVIIFIDKFKKFLELFRVKLQHCLAYMVKKYHFETMTNKFLDFNRHIKLLSAL